MIITANGKQHREIQQDLCPVRIVESKGVKNPEGLLTPRTPSVVCLGEHDWTVFEGIGSYVILDYGKEVCGSIRMIIAQAELYGRWRFTFGESLSEACSTVGGEKNATNDHQFRDFEVGTSMNSDVRIGQTGFRFVRIEFLVDDPTEVQNIFATTLLPYFEREAKIVTNDTLLNDIIDTAAYTLKLCFQNNHIWDGIKRDRLVWCGDLHPEILTGLYLFGDNENITNSLSFLCENTPADKWINTIPTYSAWWVINLCDYCTFTGNWDYFRENREYALAVIEHFNSCVTEDGQAVLTDGLGMEYFLDWSTFGFEDATAGVCALIRIMAQKFVAIEENSACRRIIDKLEGWTKVPTTMKPVRAFQVLAGRDCPAEDAAMLQAEGARGFSTFMAYYILTAMAKCGGSDMLDIIKTYYGGMLSRGATSFWEDFDIDWLEGSGRIDELPKDGQKDIHGDYGKHCYQQFRHSLCHGWSAGVYAFIVEYILGLSIKDGGKTYSVNSHLMGLTDIDAEFPIADGTLKISIHGGKIDVFLV